MKAPAQWTNYYPSPDWGPIAYLECIDGPVSPVEEWGIKTSTVTRTFLCEWEKRNKFAASMLGYATLSTQGGKTYVKRRLPYHYGGMEAIAIKQESALIPDDADSVYAASVRIEGAGAPKDWTSGADRATKASDLTLVPAAMYQVAKVEVKYIQLPFEILGDSMIGSTQMSGAPDEATLKRYVEKKVNPACDYLRLPPGGFNYIKADGTDGSPVPGSPGILQPNYDFSLIWHQVPQRAVGLPLLSGGANDAIIRCIGRMNIRTFAGEPPGTLLLVAVIITRYRNYFGWWLCDVEYRFKYINLGTAKDDNPAGHTYLYSPWLGIMDGPGYYEVSNNETNISIVAGVNVLASDFTNIYNWADFHSLFRPDGDDDT
jgi:hypothetical protein